MPIKLMLNTVLHRVREPSSWSGIAVLLAMFGLSQEQTGVITELLAATAALASVFISEPGKPS
uniref:Uncharacterized protein n=1 Tax=Magnetococcus massalia (strain MO-1) TaxID=451514 RepID=A0A1S7LJP0_MAGMO|nr:conserved exported protein of unknown function [Candidatus Magnetococcus massalia]